MPLGKRGKACKSWHMNLKIFAAMPSPDFLDGQMLIAMPGMPDDRFTRTVIYLCAHTSEGAMGIVVNRQARSIAFPELLVQLDIIAKDQAIRLPPRGRARRGHGGRAGGKPRAASFCIPPIA